MGEKAGCQRERKGESISMYTLVAYWVIYLNKKKTCQEYRAGDGIVFTLHSHRTDEFIEILQMYCKQLPSIHLVA
jgi:hypothetical protein